MHLLHLVKLVGRLWLLFRQRKLQLDRLTSREAGCEVQQSSCLPGLPEIDRSQAEPELLLHLRVQLRHAALRVVHLTEGGKSSMLRLQVSRQGWRLISCHLLVQVHLIDICS